MSYVKHSRVPLPDGLREVFPNHGKVAVDVTYSGSGREVCSEIHIILVPTMGGPDFIPVCSIDGPIVGPREYAKAVDSAKELLSDTRYLERIIEQNIRRIKSQFPSSLQ